VIVVADSSPLIVLVNIGRIEILPALFHEVFIPPKISAELTDPKRPQAVRNFIQTRRPWLHVHSPAVLESIPELHEGERAAISLATELKGGPFAHRRNRQSFGRTCASSADYWNNWRFAARRRTGACSI